MCVLLIYQMSIPPYKGQVPSNGAVCGTVSSSNQYPTTSDGNMPNGVWRDDRGRFAPRPVGPYEPSMRQSHSAPKNVTLGYQKRDPLQMMQDGMGLIKASMESMFSLVTELQKDCRYMATENLRSQRVIKETLSSLSNQRNRGNRATTEHSGGRSSNVGQWANQGYYTVNQEQRSWYVARPTPSATVTSGAASNPGVELSVSVQDRRSPMIDPGCPEDLRVQTSEAAEVPRVRRTSSDRPQSPL